MNACEKRRSGLATFLMSKRCNSCRNRKKCQKKVLAAFFKKIFIFVIILFVLWSIAKVISVITRSFKDDINPVRAESVLTESETDETEEVPELAKRGDFTEEELTLMGKVVWLEARGECYEGKVAVAAVILNRLETGRREFGAQNGSVTEVITKEGAFASVEGFYDWTFENSPEYEDCMNAVRDAVNGIDPTRAYFQNGALFFYSTIVELSDYQMARREGIEIYEIGNHAFHVELKQVEE